MAPRYIRVRLCPRKHQPNPFNNNIHDGSDTVCVNIRPPLRVNPERYEIGLLWAEAMDNSFVNKLNLPDEIPFEMLRFHGPKEPCPIHPDKGLQADDMVDVSRSTSHSNLTADALSKVIHIDIVGAGKNWWKPGPKAGKALPNKAKQKQKKPSPKEIRMMICPNKHTKLTGNAGVDIQPNGRLASSINEVGRLFVAQLAAEGSEKWSKVNSKSYNWELHAQEDCEDPLEVQDLVDDYLCDPNDPVTKKKLVYVHVITPEAQPPGAGTSELERYKKLTGGEPRGQGSGTLSGSGFGRPPKDTGKRKHGATDPDPSRDQAPVKKKSKTARTSDPPPQSDQEDETEEQDVDTTSVKQGAAKQKGCQRRPAKPSQNQQPKQPRKPKKTTRRAPAEDPEPCDELNEEGIPEFPETNENLAIIRVGRVRSEDIVTPGNSKAFAMRVFVVAAADGENDNVEFLEVPAWTVNGEQVGAYTFADLKGSIDGIEHYDEFEADTFWEMQHSQGKLNEAIWNYIANDMQPPAKRDTEDWPDNVRPEVPENAKVATPYKPPTRPVHTHGVPKNQVSGDKPDDTGEISAVVCFANYTGGILPITPINLQVDLKYNQSWKSFKKWLKRVELWDGDEKTPHNLQELVRIRTAKYWLKWDIWVLPQWEGDKLCPWKPDDQRDASDFLDKAVFDSFGKQLFIMVRLKGDPDGEGKDRAWVDIGKRYSKRRTWKLGLKRKRKDGKVRRSKPTPFDDSDGE